MTRRKISIEWLHDEHDCETCGSSYSEGARFFLDGKLLVELIPVAHCFDGRHWDEGASYAEALRALGYEVEVAA